MNNHTKKTGGFLLFIIAVMLVACLPASAPSTERPPEQVAAVTEPAPTVEDTPEATMTVVVTQPTLAETQPPSAGLVYRNQEGLWQVESDGQSRLLTGHADAMPSPDLSFAYLWDHANSSLTLIDLRTGQEKILLSDPLLNGSFSWASNQTILLGLYSSPEEADGPNYGHLTSLDVDSETVTVLDSERLLSSPPALSPDGLTIAYSSDGPFLYSEDGGSRPFPAETYSGLSNVSGHFSPAWSPDGHHLAWIVSGGPFGDDPDLTMGLALYELEAGTASLRLAFDPARWGAMPPAAIWGPDGLWLALRVFANGPEGSGIWLLSAYDNREHYLPGVSGNANYPVWSPESRRLIFDMDKEMSDPIDMATGLGLLWLGYDAGEGPLAEQPGSDDPLCSNISRPALLLIDRGDYYITNFKDHDACPFIFPGELPGLIQSGGDALFYHEMDFTTQTAVVKRLGPDGTEATLSFTETGPPARFLHYLVSPDGRQVVWSTSRTDESGQPVSDLWLAGTDGSGQKQLLTGIPGTDNRFAIPIRFSADGQTLYYAMQPIGVGGSWVAFNGRYDSLYTIPTSGGLPVEIFQCPDGSLLCLGDFTGEGEALRVAYTDQESNSIEVAVSDGQPVGRFSFPDADFLGYPTFGPGGDLAFSVAAIGEHADGYPIPQPGTIYLVLPPYDGQPQLVKSDDTVATLIGWLDSERLVYNSIDPGGNWGTAITSLTGQATIWGPGPTQFITILR